MPERRNVRFLSSITKPLESLSAVDRLRDLLAGKGGDGPNPAPFSPEDTTAGGESELQAAVVGSNLSVDLPLTIEQSNYFANIVRRTATGDMSRRTVAELERFLGDTRRSVWENSWVRFPKAALSAYAREILERDLLADKANRAGGRRSDVQRFTFSKEGEEFLRVPISYLIKVSLADAVSVPGTHALIHRVGARLLDHFLSDNTSPETHSFYLVTGCRGEGPGRGLARETAKRFLLTQLLVMYGNQKFHLTRNGQKAVVYFSSHPPVRQKKLNDCISDSFYRELFMSPCLSGWDKGESKQDYMHLCHQVLSRSQLNAVGKLRDAGIITSNLAVLPNTSNISLANNGTHVSLGSIGLTELRRDSSSGFGAREEKYLGDLMIKTGEHFLPLFVKTYSADPYRLAFSDFHPERVLGFLPHELDYTHLRMLWRRWKAKANIRFFGRPVTPFGPIWIDEAISRTFGLSGDFIPDFRLVDYLVALMSSEKSPALNGVPGNSEALKKDLSDLGVFDTRMSLYLALKLREFNQIGFCGQEGRYYSLFQDFARDMAPAVDLQNLVAALSFRYILDKKVTHRHIPDTPFVESERRQIFFGAAIGIPTFFVRQDTDNLFLKAVVARARNVRSSRRYAGYLRVANVEYCRALLRVILEDGADLVESFHMEAVLEDLQQRLDDPGARSVAGRLTKEVMDGFGRRSPLRAKADEFNAAAENFYRNRLRLRQMSEAFRFLEEEVRNIGVHDSPRHDSIGRLLRGLLGTEDPGRWLKDAARRAAAETMSADDIRKLISTVLLTVDAHSSEASDSRNPEMDTGT